MSGKDPASLQGRHVFVAVEAGQSSKALDWDAIRHNVAATGGYLSLALIDGAKSNWIVRPVPEAHQIPLRVSTTSAGAAAPGIAASVIDQLMEAQGLVPAILSTEVRLYGGALAETELNDALSGESTIELRVFEQSKLRAARSVHKPLASASPNRNSGVPAHKPHAPQAPKPTPRPAAARSSPQTHQPMKPNPNSLAGRMAAAGQASAPVQSRTTQAMPGLKSASGGQSSRLNQPAARQSFANRYKPLRRLVAGLLAAAVVVIGVFLGYVWTNIWDYTYPRDASSIADAVSDAQSRAFGVSILFGGVIALFGTRARWLTLLGFGYGITAGIVPTAIPEFLAWRAPGPIVGIFSNTAGFWGIWTAYAPLIYLVAGIALCSAVAKVLPETSRAVVAARARNRKATKDWLGRRSPVDKWAISLLLWLGLTAIAPWLLGRFALQDNLIFETGAGVFDADGREFWQYVPPLYLGGLAILLVLAGLAMVFQPWAGRNGLGITGLVLLSAGFAAGAFGSTLWTAAEQGTAARLTTTAFPFSDQFLTCGHAEATLTDASGETWLYQVWTARIKESEVGSYDCNRLQVYKGWQWVEGSDLPDGQIIADGPTFVGGTTSADAVFQYVQSDGQTIQLTVDGP